MFVTQRSTREYLKERERERDNRPRDFEKEIRIVKRRSRANLGLHTPPFAMEMRLVIFKCDTHTHTHTHILTKGDRARSLMTMPRYVEMHKVLHFHIDTIMFAVEGWCILIPCLLLLVQ